MRALADAGRVHELMRALGRVARQPASIYFTGGEAKEALRYLEVQVLVQRDRDRFHLRENLRGWKEDARAAALVAGAVENHHV